MSDHRKHPPAALRSAQARERNAERAHILAIASNDMRAADLALAEALEERAAIEAIKAAMEGKS